MLAASYRCDVEMRMASGSKEADAPTGGETRAGGVVRRIDELGRIVIPVEIRKRFGIRDRDPLEISVQGDSVVLTRPIDRCVFCSSLDDLTAFHERSICAACMSDLRGDVVSAR
ncbi:MAG: AbrB family transcriptional regulator, transcriptional pleiotropic regulator of transition state [Gaiellales bacterium]|jgi:AbrB family transcriptional regulator, transcriptional pleiotropic regulator of transition state genes|nr:AbrB family transcriptional regulator, transcriptional pleiotropic regulator of transition state [Gaiellales bacterium]